MFPQHQNVLLHFHFWDLISSFDPELCICIYVAYQPAFGWPPLPIFNLLPEKMLFAFDEVKTRVGHSVSDYAASFAYMCLRLGYPICAYIFQIGLNPIMKNAVNVDMRFFPLQNPNIIFESLNEFDGQ